MLPRGDPNARLDSVFEPQYGRRGHIRKNVPKAPADGKGGGSKEPWVGADGERLKDPCEQQQGGGDGQKPDGETQNQDDAGEGPGFRQRPADIANGPAREEKQEQQGNGAGDVALSPVGQARNQRGKVVAVRGDRNR